MNRTKSIEQYHRAFLEILKASSDQPELDPLSATGHEKLRALIEEIHDQGYVLGQLHAEGIFPEGAEDEVGQYQERLGIEVDSQGRKFFRAVAQHAYRGVGDAGCDWAAGIPVHTALDDDPLDRSGDAVAGRDIRHLYDQDPVKPGLDLLQAVEEEAERARRQYQPDSNPRPLMDDPAEREQEDHRQQELDQLAAEREREG